MIQLKDVKDLCSLFKDLQELQKVEDDRMEVSNAIKIDVNFNNDMRLVDIIISGVCKEENFKKN